MGVPQILCKLLLNKGDSILVEEYTYAHMVESTIQLHGFKAVPVAMDAQGSPFSLPPPPSSPRGSTCLCPAFMVPPGLILVPNRKGLYENDHGALVGWRQACCRAPCGG